MKHFFLILNSSNTQFVQNDSKNILDDYTLLKTEIKDSSVMRNGKEEVGILQHTCTTHKVV